MFSLTTCRTLYSQAAEQEEAAQQLLKATTEWKEKEVIAKAYWGTANMILAKYAFFPLQKWNRFQMGKKALEEAIKMAPDVTELRFLRLSIQQSAPTLLQYFENIKEDKIFILKNIEKEDIEIQIAFKTFSQKYNV